MNALADSEAAICGTWPVGRCCIFSGSARSRAWRRACVAWCCDARRRMCGMSAALVCLAVLAALPVAIAAWVGS